MSPAVKKVATNLPEALLEEARRLSGLNQTQVLVEGLKELIARKKRDGLLALHGRMRIRIDTDRTRQRRRT